MSLLLRQCGTSKLLRLCSSSKLMLSCASTDPCDYDEILATVTGLSLCSCADLFALGEGYVFQNLSLYSMPVTLTKVTACCFEAQIGTVDLYSFNITEDPPCTTLTFVATIPLALFAYCWSGNTVNVIQATGLGGYGLETAQWSDGGVNGWTDWPNPNFGTFTRFTPDCPSPGILTSGGTVTLEAP
jgi:hypothetical protein